MRRGEHIPAGDVEALVLDHLRAFLASEKEIKDALAGFNLDAATQRSVLAKATELAEN